VAGVGRPAREEQSAVSDNCGPFPRTPVVNFGTVVTLVVTSITLDDNPVTLPDNRVRENDNPIRLDDNPIQESCNQTRPPEATFGAELDGEASASSA